jgi:hypothetical protein
MDEHRLAVAAIVPVSGMLRHVCVDDDAVRRSVSESEGLVCLYLSKEFPASGGAGDIPVDESTPRECSYRGERRPERRIPRDPQREHEHGGRRHGSTALRVSHRGVGQIDIEF